jgi:Spy/CpxP family protein refolding chaperone
MKQRTRIIILSLGILLSVSLLAAAQGGPRLRQRRMNRPGAPAEDLAQTVQLFYVDGLRKELNLSDEQTLKLIPLVQKAEEDRRAMHRQKRQIMERLRALAGDEKASDGEIEKALGDFFSIEDQFRRQEKKNQDEIAALLTPRQRAQFIIYTMQFRERIEGKIRELREQRRLGQSPPEEQPRPGRLSPEGREGLPEDNPSLPQGD